MGMRIKKNDTVFVLSGKDKGKQGVVIAVFSKKDKVKVKGVFLATRHKKARKAGGISGIRKEERFISMSSIVPVCSSCKKPCRVNSKVFSDKKRTRACNKCKELL